MRPLDLNEAARNIFFGSPTPEKVQSAERTPEANVPRFRELSATPLKVSAACKSKFTHYSKVDNPYAKKYLRKLMDICTHTAEQCENPRAVLQHLQSSFERNHSAHTLFVHAEMDSPFNQLYQYWLSQQDRKSVLRGLMMNDVVFPRFSVRFHELEDLGVGVTRTFFQRVVDDMIENQKIFEPLDNSKKATRYTLRKVENPDKDLYTFVGELLGFCLLNEIPIPIYLARSLLIRMIYKENEIDPDMDVMYMITDYPESSQAILNELMFSEHLDMDDMGRYIQLSDAERGLDASTNPEQFFEVVKKYMRARVRGAVICPAMSYVANGFFLSRDARKHNWTVDRLDRLISGNVITQESIQQLVQFLQISQAPQLILELLAKKMNDKAFIEALMQYWTGMRKIDLNAQPPYQVIFIEKGLPMASTCFNQLKIPKDVSNVDELIQRFDTAMKNAGATFGLD